MPGGKSWEWLVGGAGSAWREEQGVHGAPLPQALSWARRCMCPGHAHSSHVSHWQPGSCGHEAPCRHPKRMSGKVRIRVRAHTAPPAPAPPPCSPRDANAQRIKSTAGLMVVGPPNQNDDCYIVVVRDKHQAGVSLQVRVQPCWPTQLHVPLSGCWGGMQGGVCLWV